MIGSRVLSVAFIAGIALLVISCGSTPAFPEPVSSDIVWPEELHPMGTTLEFSDGLALRVNPIQAGPATRYAYGAAEGSNVLMFYVTITNDTQSPYDPSQAVIDLTYDGLSAPRVFDSSHEDMAFANGSFEGFIDTRHHSTAGWLFAIPETQMDDMRMRVDLDPHRAPSYFSGSFSPPQDLPATN